MSKPVVRTSPSLSPAAASPLAELVEIPKQAVVPEQSSHQDLSNWPKVFSKRETKLGRSVCSAALNITCQPVRASCLQKGPLRTPQRHRAQGPSCTAAGQPSLPASRFQLEGTQLLSGLRPHHCHDASEGPLRLAAGGEGRHPRLRLASSKTAEVGTEAACGSFSLGVDPVAWGQGRRASA